jgi:hypothetical protein
MKIIQLAFALFAFALSSCVTVKPQDVAPVALFVGGSVVLVSAGLLAPHADEALVAGFGPGEVAPPVCWTTTAPSLAGAPHVFVDCSDPCDAHWSDPELRADCKAMRAEHGIEITR